MLYQISSGQGPAECELGVAKFLEYLQRNHVISLVDFSAAALIGQNINAKTGL